MSSESPRQAREAFVDARCRDDSSLGNAVRRLLAASDGLEDFLACPSNERAGATCDAEEAHPARIGRYEIRRVIGTGGMGIVYEALQRGVNRRVALKVIHPALVSRQWLRRYRGVPQELRGG